MKLLILTQKVDSKDPILGFFYNWILKLSPRFKSIIVICLQKGEYDLPQNVQVFSLGKEKGGNRLQYIFKFFHLCFFQSFKYDVVFVHMNQEYVLLGGLFWKMLGKRIYLWRNHPKGSFFTNLAVFLSDKVFCTSNQSFTAKSKKTALMPMGIDTNKFSILNSQFSNPERKNKILSLGRISPIKNIEKMTDVAMDIYDQGIDFVLDIVGDPVNREDGQYLERLKDKARSLIEKGIINFIPAVSQKETVFLYQNHQIFINLTPSGSLDKTILESIVCGCIPIVMNQAFKNVFDEKGVTSGEVKEISEKIKFWLNIKEEERSAYSKILEAYVLENHSLDMLINKLCLEIH